MVNLLDYAEWSNFRRQLSRFWVRIGKDISTANALANWSAVLDTWPRTWRDRARTW